MFNGTNLNLNSDLDQDAHTFGSHEKSLLIDVSSPSNMYKRVRMKNWTQQYIQLNTGTKETLCA